MNPNDSNSFHSPVWDRGDPIDAEMMAFTIGDDWRMDQRLVECDLRGSMAHVDGLLSAKLVSAEDHKALRGGLEALLESWKHGEWNVEPGDEDVHSAVERRLTAALGEVGERLHTGRSRNDQVALDMRLWLRGAQEEAGAKLQALINAAGGLDTRQGHLPLPGYTHLRRGMPSSVKDWIGAHVAALQHSQVELKAAAERIADCPLGSGAGYGVPLPLDRELVAQSLGFRRPEHPVTATQLARGRGELSYLNALEGLALDIEKLAFDLWLFTSEEFGFLHLPLELTTGSSLMPHKRNPDLVELVRGHCRQLATDRDALRAVVAGLPSGYHRDFQLIKPPLFRGHDRMMACLRMTQRLLDGVEFQEAALEEAAADPSLQVTRKALEKAQAGQSFRSAYREESQGKS